MTVTKESSKVIHKKPLQIIKKKMDKHSNRKMGKEHNL